MYHVKEYPYPVPGNLDLNLAKEEEFSPDKLRSNIERLYMTVVSVDAQLLGRDLTKRRLSAWLVLGSKSCVSGRGGRRDVQRGSPL